MQQRRRLSAPDVARVALCCVILGTATGCPSPPATAPPPGPGRPAGASLAVACSDPVYAGRLAQQAKAWAGRTGVAVRVVPDFADADVLVLPPGHLGATLSRPGFECLPTPGVSVHAIMLVDAGIHIIENLDLEEIASMRRSRIIFIAMPLRLTGSTGSPIRAIALA